MKAVVLAAGYATRLYPLTRDFPKCLLEVAGKTILDRLCEKLVALDGLEEIVLVTNAKFFGHLSRWNAKTSLKVPVTVLDDGTASNETRLGAIGDFRLCLKKSNVLSETLLVASDNLFEEGLDGFVRFARSKKDRVSIASYDIKDPRLAAGKFGVIESDATGKVIGIEEKPQNPKSSFIGMGVYYFPGSSLKFVDEYLSQQDPPDAPGYYVRWLMKKTEIFSFQFSGLWYDIGNLEALEEANKVFSCKSGG